MGYVPLDAYFDDEQNIASARGTQRPAANRSPKGAPAAKSASARRAPAQTTKAVAPAGNRAPARKKAPTRPTLAENGKKLLRQVMSTKGGGKVKTVKSEKKKPFPMTALFMAILCTGLLMFMVVSYVQINEYTVEVASLRSELNDMVDQDKELSLALEKKNDMLEIERKAGELGMVKVDQLTKKHIALSQEDKIEVIEDEPSRDSTVVTTIMSSIIENFSGLWEYMH